MEFEAASYNSKGVVWLVFITLETYHISKCNDGMPNMELPFPTMWSLHHYYIENCFPPLQLLWGTILMTTDHASQASCVVLVPLSQAAMPAVKSTVRPNTETGSFRETGKPSLVAVLRRVAGGWWLVDGRLAVHRCMSWASLQY
jgi:hypothetical protein